MSERYPNLGAQTRPNVPFPQFFLDSSTRDSKGNLGLSRLFSPTIHSQSLRYVTISGGLDER